MPKGMPLSDAHRAKILAAMQSPETRAKIRESKLGNRYRRGSKHSPESLDKMRKAHSKWDWESVPGHTEIHRQAFFNLQARAYDLGTDMSNTLEGYALFVARIGPVPPWMKKPSVGRIDHSKGYVEGNFRWQEFSENVREMLHRR